MKNIIIILFLLISSICFGQTNREIHLIKSKLYKKENKEKWNLARSYNNEYDLFFSRLFLFYKNFISSQDANNCSFTPSCSVYAIQAVKEEGTIVGLINFFDRFTRCNSLSPEDYEIDSDSRLLIDPVRNFHFEMIHNR